MQTARQQKIADRKRQVTRYEAVTTAFDDETARFCAALKNGAHVVIQTAFGAYVVHGIGHDHWYLCHAVGSSRNSFTDRSFAGCNDGTWADMMKQAGVSRNPLFD